MKAIQQFNSADSLISNMQLCSKDHPSHDIFIQRIKELYPQFAHELQIAYNYICAINLENVEFDEYGYTSEIISIIEQSELSESSKNALKNGIEIGFASSDLWDR